MPDPMIPIYDGRTPPLMNSIMWVVERSTAFSQTGMVAGVEQLSHPTLDTYREMAGGLTFNSAATDWADGEKTRACRLNLGHVPGRLVCGRSGKRGS